MGGLGKGEAPIKARRMAYTYIYYYYLGNYG